MYGKTYMGIQRASFIINSDGKIAAIWPKVKVTGHAADVLETLKAL
jgi:peroxiredoxin Q/BCP